jgi:hypothetical protein
VQAVRAENKELHTEQRVARREQRVARREQRVARREQRVARREQGFEAEAGASSERARQEAVYRSRNSRVYNYVRLEIARPRQTAGICAAIYKLAGEYGAARYTKRSFLCGERWNSLDYELYFMSPSDARRFMGHMQKVGFYWGLSRVQVHCPRSQKPVVLPHVNVLSICRTDYDTNDNPHSPKVIIYDMELERASLNDEKQLQMFEKPPVNLRSAHTNVILNPKSDTKRMNTMKTT